MRQKIELEIVSYCSNLKRKAEIFKAAGGLFCLKEEPRKEVGKGPISIRERPILSASNLGNSDQRLAMAGEQLRCSTWQMRKGGIPTFLSHVTLRMSYHICVLVLTHISVLFCVNSTVLYVTLALNRSSSTFYFK